MTAPMTCRFEKNLRTIVKQAEDLARSHAQRMSQPADFCSVCNRKEGALFPYVRCTHTAAVQGPVAGHSILSATVSA